MNRAPEAGGAGHPLRIEPLGDEALLVDLGTVGDDRADARRARIVAAALEGERIPTALEHVPGFGTVLVQLARPLDVGAAARMVERLRGVASSALSSSVPEPAGRLHEVPVVYDGPDLASVAEASRLSVDDLVALHAGATYEAEVIGFLPGFAYLGELDPRLRAPRLAAPRPRVRAGSVGVAGTRTAVYPLTSPGGWRLLGRAVGFSPFAPDALPPCRLLPGDRVRFVPVDAPIGAEPIEAPIDGRALAPGASHAAESGAGAGGVAATRQSRTGRAILVERIGPGATVQDEGRPGLRRYGVPASGPLDPETWAAATRAVDTHVAIELPLLGARFRAVGGIVFSIDGEPARTCESGETIDVPRAGRAVRYLAVRGGLPLPEVLGARATLLAAGIGGLEGRALRRGDALPVGPPDEPGGPGGPREREEEGPHAGATEPAGPAHEVATLRILPAFDVDPRHLEALLVRRYRVDPRSDRVGVRLDGDPVVGVPEAVARSWPTVAGLVQLPPDGRPIVLGPDGPTTGGYLPLGVLDRGSRVTLSRLRPGTLLRFTLT